jgi:hypothetical protein
MKGTPSTYLRYVNFQGRRHTCVHVMLILNSVVIVHVTTTSYVVTSSSREVSYQGRPPVSIWGRAEFNFTSEAHLCIKGRKRWL